MSEQTNKRKRDREKTRENKLSLGKLSTRNSKVLSKLLHSNTHTNTTHTHTHIQQAKNLDSHKHKKCLTKNAQTQLRFTKSNFYSFNKTSILRHRKLCAKRAANFECFACAVLLDALSPIAMNGQAARLQMEYKKVVGASGFVHVR